MLRQAQHGKDAFGVDGGAAVAVCLDMLGMAKVRPGWTGVVKGRDA